MVRALGLAVLTVAAASSPAAAQAVTHHYAAELTDGVDIPNTPLAGDQDARAVAYNPGGLTYLQGGEVGAALTLEDSSLATSTGAGFGIYAGGAIGGRLLPRAGFGIALEWLDPARDRLTPDPGQPFRFTLATAQSIAGKLSVGVSWHHFVSDGALAGVDSFDVGVATRLGDHLALGGVVRDLAAGSIAGTAIERRYEAELVLRPLAGDRLAVAVGGRIGETSHDVDGWARATVRAARGSWLTAGIETRALHDFEESATGTTEVAERDVRATLGIELSFGHAGGIAMVTGLRDPVTDNSNALGGTVYARASTAVQPSLLGEPDHIERIELTGELGVRQVTQLVARLRAIARDPHAIGLVIAFEDASGGWATFEELRAEVAAVRRAGKKTFAYMVTGSSRDYLVASACDRIYIDPAGGLRLVGLGSTSLYFRGALDLIGVLPQFEKIGEYKSAPEQFTQAAPTGPAERMHEELFDSIWGEWVAAVASGRRLGAADVQTLVDAGPYSAGQLADPGGLAHRLVDGVGTPEQISAWVMKELGRVVSVDTPPEVRDDDRWQRPGIAVIYIDGDIVDGKSRTLPIVDQKLVGGETIVAALTAARDDPNVKAIVLRVDSPGGSALAAELIAREVFATRGVKPILCSFGSVAASGGYFVAAGCDAIYAEPMTITGSIGIFYGKFDLGGLLGKLGITTATVKRGAHADVESMYRPWTDEEREQLLGELRYSYGRFVGAVAEGRGLTKDAVDGVGRGHVWTGAQAAPIHLIDRTGGIGDAIDDAKRRASVGDDAQVIELPHAPTTLLGQLAALLGVDADADASLAAQLPVLRELLHELPASLLVSPTSAQARLPFEVVW
jgi:protease-4